MTGSGGRRWWALAALVLGLLTIGLDATVLNTALPTIAVQLSAGTDDLQWVVNSYVLVFAGLLLPFGALGDRYGRKRLLLVGLALFGMASVAAALAGTIGQMITARAVMGAGAAIMMPIALAVIPVLFGPRERSRAISVAMVGMGAGIPLGPIVGGYLLDRFWWGSIFLVNVPVAAVGVVAIGLLLPESRDPVPRRTDVLGGLLSTVGLVAFVYGVIEAPGRGWGDWVTVAALVSAVVLLAAFVRWESRTADPMIDVTLFGRAPFLWGTVAATLVSFAMFGLLFVVPQYLQFVRGFDALGTGVRLLPLIGGLVVGAPSGERIADRVGHRLPVTVGLLAVAGGLALGATTGATTGYGLAAAWLAVVGLGFGLAMAPAMDAVLGALPVERAGSGTAITQALRNAAGALGVALLGSLLAQGYADRLPATGPAAAPAGTARESIAGALTAAATTGDPALAAAARVAFMHGMTLVLGACAVIALVGAGLVAAFLPAGSANARGRRDGTRGRAEESAHELARSA
jgi:EmrB/QacA subfamily drug resistance transporter